MLNEFFPTKSAGASRFIRTKPSQRNEAVKSQVSFIKAFREKFDGKQEQHELCDLTESELLTLLFELLKIHAHEYNAAVGLGPFHIEITPPQNVMEVVKADRMSGVQVTVTFFRAKLCTSTHALSLRADPNGLAFFIMPIERMLGLSRQEALFEPETFLRLTIHKGKVYWQTKAGLPLTMSRVEGMSRALFQWLIERTSDRVNGN